MPNHRYICFVLLLDTFPFLLDLASSEIVLEPDFFTCICDGVDTQPHVEPPVEEVGDVGCEPVQIFHKCFDVTAHLVKF